jgi:hypothetical protein
MSSGLRGCTNSTSRRGCLTEACRPTPDPRGVRPGPHRRDRTPLQRRHPRPAHQLRDPLPAHRDQPSGARPVRPHGTAASRRGVGRARRGHPPCASGRFGHDLPGDTGLTRVPHLISRVGRQVPAHAGAPAKVLLAERADDELPLGDEPLRALTDNAHTARTTLPAGLGGTGAWMLGRPERDGRRHRRHRVHPAVRRPGHRSRAVPVPDPGDRHTSLTQPRSRRSRGRWPGARQELAAGSGACRYVLTNLLTSPAGHFIVRPPSAH